MADYIDKQAAIQELEKARLFLLDRHMYGAEHILVYHAISVIEGIPSADVKPVVRGRWIVKPDDFEDFIECSNCCEQLVALFEGDNPKYCPNCGSFNGAELGGDAT